MAKKTVFKPSNRLWEQPVKWQPEQRNTCKRNKCNHKLKTGAVTARYTLFLLLFCPTSQSICFSHAEELAKSVKYSKNGRKSNYTSSVFIFLCNVMVDGATLWRNHSYCLRKALRLIKFKWNKPYKVGKAYPVLYWIKELWIKTTNRRSYHVRKSKWGFGHGWCKCLLLLSTFVLLLIWIVQDNKWLLNHWNCVIPIVRLYIYSIVIYS